MAAIFSERMERLETGAAEKNFGILERYIQYMAERMEFSMKNMGRAVGEAGTSAAEVVLALRALQNDLSALQSTVNQLSGDLSGVKGQLGTLTAAVSDVQSAAAALTARVEALEAKEGDGG